MFGLSTLWLRLIGGAVILGALLFGLQRVYHAGYAARDTEAKLELSQAMLHAAKESDELRVAFADLKIKKDVERKHAEQQISHLRADLASGALRLSIPAPTPEPGAPSPGPGAPEARTELDAKTAQDLVSIAADGDAAIRDLNQCIDAYQALKEKLNGTH